MTANLIEVGVQNLNDFEWIQQLRYYWEDELLIRVVNSEFKYGYEYLGNSGRLVITPLTDRYKLTVVILADFVCIVGIYKVLKLCNITRNCIFIKNFFGNLETTCYPSQKSDVTSRTL